MTASHIPAVSDGKRMPPSSATMPSAPSNGTERNRPPIRAAS